MSARGRRNSGDRFIYADWLVCQRLAHLCRQACTFAQPLDETFKVTIMPPYGGAAVNESRLLRSTGLSKYNEKEAGYGVHNT